MGTKKSERFYEDSPERLYRLKDILRLIPISKSAWWEGVRSGRFPQSVKLGPRTTVWRESDIQALINGLK